MITSIRTNNFRKLEDFSATFTDGTNLIFGENGEGKTTVFEAIRFALFGTKAVSGTADSLTTWGKSGMWVELGISGYSIRRTSSNCRITKDDEIVADGNSACTRFIENLLGCSLKDFDLLYMSKQNETAGLITFGATELNRKVEEFAGVAVIDKVIKSLGSDVHGYQVALESFEYQSVDDLKTELSDIESKGKTAKAKVEEFDLEKSQVSKLQEDVMSDIGSANMHNSTVRQAVKANELIEKRIANLSAKFDSATETDAESQLEFSKTTEVERSEIENLEKQINDVRETSRKLDRLPAENSLAKTLESAKSNLALESEYLSLLPDLESDSNTASEAYHAASDKYRDALRARDAAKKVMNDGVCGECHRALEDHSHEDAEAKLAACEVEVAECKNVRDAASEIAETATNVLRKHNQTNPGSGWEGKVVQAESVLSDNTSARNHLESELSGMELEATLQGKCSQLKDDSLKYKRAYSATVISAQRLKGAKSDLDHEKTLAPEVVGEEIDLTDMNKKLAGSVAKLNDINASLNSWVQTKATLTQQYRSTSDSLQLAEANNKKMAELTDKLNTSKSLRKYLNDERVKFMEGVWRTILGTATHFISKSTSGWITQVGRNDRGEFTFFENGIEAAAKDVASGAQKAFIGTAIKVGLAQAKMGSSSMVLLDEPTADMRDENASKLAAGLMMLSGQKIMITHRDSERMVAQNIIQVGEGV